MKILPNLKIIYVYSGLNYWKMVQLGNGNWAKYDRNGFKCREIAREEMMHWINGIKIVTKEDYENQPEYHRFK